MKKIYDKISKIAFVTVTFPPPTANEDITSLVAGILKWMMVVATPIAVIIIIYAGVVLLTSKGDPGKTKTGKAILTWAVIGLAVIYIGGGFITLIRSIIGLAK
jgi:hypothetical protein